MDVGVTVAIVLVLAFAFTNGVQDAANSIATLVATRAAPPALALAIATLGILVGPLFLGSAVATTIAGIVELERREAIEVATAAPLAALAWNGLTWLRGIPSSASHALVGALAGAAVAAGGLGAVEWGGFEGWRPTGVGGTLVALAVAPLLGAGAAYGVFRLARRALRRATRRLDQPVRRSQLLMSGLLALAQGANDAQKSIGVVALVLLAHGTTSSLAAPVWATLAAAGSMAAGTLLGGWGIVRTIGRRIYPLRALDSLASQTGSAGVILLSSLAGAPVSATHVVASSVVGVGGGRRGWGRIRWAVVSEIALAWLTTIPATAALAAIMLTVWRLLT